jgi:hypothetical protein
MPSNLCNLDGHLESDVEGTAEWRRQKAEESPDDKRNLEAAEALDRLALEIGALEGSELHQQISDGRSHRPGCLVRGQRGPFCRASAAGVVSGREQSEIGPLLNAAAKNARKFAKVPPFWA